MNTEGIIWRARRLTCAAVLALIVPVAFAQTPPAHKGDDLDVTMRVIVDPDAKVPDEIVRRIQLPKPAQPGTAPASQPDKSAEHGASGNQHASDAHGQGREFGEQVSDQAKQRSEEARRNGKPPGTPGPPPNPPGPPKPPPGRPGG